MSAYYNENDPKAAAWIRELIKAGLIAPGDVDERSITEVSPHDLTKYTQCHFFAGVAGWSLALRLAGWSDGTPVWSGSCPCQPFSAAGKRKGTADERHLWPIFRELIRACKPSIVFGEQVASKDGRLWLAGVFADLEGMAYQRAGADLCAAGVGAPHIRQRLYWMAVSAGFQPERRRITGIMESAGRALESEASEREWRGDAACDCSAIGRLAYANGGQCRDGGLQPCREHGQQPEDGCACGMEHAASDGREQRRTESDGWSIAGGCGAWDSFNLLLCTDGKARRIKRSLEPLVARIPSGMVHGRDSGIPINPEATAEARGMRLRGYGNAIVPQLAAEFIQAAVEAIRLS